MNDDAVDQALRGGFAARPVPAPSADLDARIMRRVADMDRRRRAARFLLTWTAATAFCAGVVLASTGAAAAHAGIIAGVLAGTAGASVLAATAARA